MQPVPDNAAHSSTIDERYDLEGGTRTLVLLPVAERLPCDLLGIGGTVLEFFEDAERAGRGHGDSRQAVACPIIGGGRFDRRQRWCGGLGRSLARHLGGCLGWAARFRGHRFELDQQG